MQGNQRKEDLRIVKTRHALLDSLQRLLEHRSFARLTVNDLCEEARISRTAFYAHFCDKYDLLEYWLKSLESKMLHTDEAHIGRLFQDNTKKLANLMVDANKETLDLLYKLIISILDISAEKSEDGTLNPKYTALSNFCPAGIVNYLSWQIKDKSSPELKSVNSYFISMLLHLLEWEPY